MMGSSGDDKLTKYSMPGGSGGWRSRDASYQSNLKRIQLIFCVTLLSSTGAAAVRCDCRNVDYSGWIHWWNIIACIEMI